MRVTCSMGYQKCHCDFSAKPKPCVTTHRPRRRLVRAVRGDGVADPVRADDQQLINHPAHYPGEPMLMRQPKDD
ncbi:MAG: hypothetical protein CM1200mP29_14020 [Verrucomicrobiota bacterium]|nr:MAG: hypothetical protein CM1200mP29_14020 [Verrucomicrobiota bacterium]